MQKKNLLSNLLVGALSTACIFCATACSEKNGGNSGGRVTQTQWETAFEKTATACNLTAKMVHENDVLLTENAEYEFYYDLPNKTVYAVVEAQFYVWSEGNKSYFYFKEGEYPHAKTESEGEYDDNSLLTAIAGFDMPRYWSECVFTKGQESGKISEMYSSFEYDADNKSYVINGATSEQYSDYNEPISITVKIDGGAVSYIYIEQEHIVENVRAVDKMTITFKDYGTTAVTVPEEVKNAPLASVGE